MSDFIIISFKILLNLPIAGLQNYFLREEWLIVVQYTDKVDAFRKFIRF